MDESKEGGEDLGLETSRSVISASIAERNQVQFNSCS
jgi:hypothetical protein